MNARERSDYGAKKVDLKIIFDYVFFHRHCLVDFKKNLFYQASCPITKPKRMYCICAEFDLIFRNGLGRLGLFKQEDHKPCGGTGLPPIDWNEYEANL